MATPSRSLMALAAAIFVGGACAVRTSSAVSPVLLQTSHRRDRRSLLTVATQTSCAAAAPCLEWCEQDGLDAWCDSEGFRGDCPEFWCLEQPEVPQTTTGASTTPPASSPDPSTSGEQSPAPSTDGPTAVPPTTAPPVTTASDADSTLIGPVLGALRSSDSAGVFQYETATGWLESDLYTWADMTKAVELMASVGVGRSKLWLGGAGGHDVRYGLVNIAAFLAQCMQETIRYNACDENSWSNMAVVEEAGGTPYSSTAACGQLHQSYQNYQCTVEEDAAAAGRMACDVDPQMTLRATTQAGWYGAPPALFCAPRSNLPKAPRWDTSSPWCAQEGGWGHVAPLPANTSMDEYLSYVKDGGSCRDYAGIKTGGWAFEGEGCGDGACPGSAAPLFGVPEGRTDLESCCWWGRGVIQTTGVCNFGKLNFYMGKRAAEEGRPALFPDVDFCRNPSAICEPGSPPELKWVAGFFYWLNAVQGYTKDGWAYQDQLRLWVDGGMQLTDSGFIDGASGIVNRGCHNPPNCGTGDLHARESRADNFKRVLEAMGLK